MNKTYIDFKNKKGIFIVVTMALYLLILVIQLCFFVPSTYYEVYISSQNVPHKITTMTTYGSIQNTDTSFTRSGGKPNAARIEGKELNTGRFMCQILISTLMYSVVCCAAYILFVRKTDKPITETANEQISIFN